ncbi:TetR/AcrR family transcriptional regulator [Tunturiibacter empetritectus]|uniref:TetR/AcrR family transcriptional regulator n=1 Tax=Tunturiibacter empetritectus TaxID=3069691 RepID=UPI003D9B74CA
MPRPKTGDKRAAILRAATKTIAEDGVGASTAGIAKAAAVAEGSLFRYFPDKDRLLNELYRELKLDMRSAMIAGFPVTGLAPEANTTYLERLRHLGYGVAGEA